MGKYTITTIPVASDFPGAIECKICNTHFEVSKIGLHLRSCHKILSKQYYDEYIKEPGAEVCFCGKPNKFQSINGGYTISCSNKCAQLNVDTRKKIEETCIAKYGVRVPSQSNDVRKKMEATCIERYGVSSPYKNAGIKERGRITTLNKYGVSNVFENEEIKAKSKNTMLLRYGVELNILRPEIKEHILRKKRKDKYVNFLQRLDKKNIEYLDSEDLYVNHDCIRNYKCLECNKLFSTDSTMAYDVQCGCLRRHSKGELEIRDWLVSLGFSIDMGVFIKDDKGRLEIDILVDSPVKLGVEFCGLYWHSELYRPNDYHARKLKAASDNGIELIQIFEDEWHSKKNIVQSIILNKLKSDRTKVYARKCGVVKLDKTPRDFLNENHIQGYVASGFSYGLYSGSELLVVATFGKNRFQRDGYECLRLCTKLGYVVTGGFSRLLKAFISEVSPTLIKSYCDLRYFNGAVYESVGFTNTSKGVVGYEYCGNGFKERINRIRYQKHKLVNMKSYSEDLTEVEIMNAEGFYRIFDAGQAVYTMKL